jgi:hypothetical protein
MGIVPAMEKSSCGDWTRSGSRDDHGEEETVYIMTKMSLLSKEAARPPWDDIVELSREPTRSGQTRTCIRGWWRECSGSFIWMVLLVASVCIVPTSAAFIDFTNCLSDGYQTNTPTQLQFTPLYFNAVFNTTNSNHNLAVTVWGNVSGSGPTDLVQIPNMNDTAYWESNQTNLGGKILDNPDPNALNPKLTTLFNKVNVLTYEPWSQSVRFCNSLGGGYGCPLGPNFTANAYVLL